MTNRHFGCAALMLAAAAVFSTPALAAESAGGSSSHAAIGPRIGISSSPDQLVIGGQVVFPDFVPNLSVSPNVELGFLDNETTIGMAADFDYHFHIKSQWTPYAGAAPALVITQPEHGDSSTDAGIILIGGAEVPTRTGNRFFGELRIGIGDIPSLKLMAGWNFPL